MASLSIRNHCALILLFSCSLFCNGLMAANDCRIPHYPYALTCQAIKTPLTHGSPFALTAYQVDARVRYPRPSAVVWIPDGLGLVANERAATVINALSRLRNNRDLIWLSFAPSVGKPAFNCQPNSTQAVAQSTSLSTRIYRPNDESLRRKCAETVTALGGLASVDYVVIARAYEQMAKQLGLTQVTVFAEGRGALIASAWSAIAPRRIIFQVFDSPTRFNRTQDSLQQAQALTQALLKLFAQCEASTTCRSQFKHSAQDWLSLVHTLPATVKVKDPISLQTVSLNINAEMLAAWTSQLLRQPSKSRWLPLVLSHALNGDWQPMLGLLVNGWQKEPPAFNHALSMTEQCAYAHITDTKADKANQQNSAAAIAQWFYQAEQARTQQLCAGLPAYQPNNITFHPQTPTLVLMGLANPFVETVWPNHQDLTLVQSPGAGHSLLSYACTKDVVYRYFKIRDHLAEHKPVPALDVSCLRNVPTPRMDYRDPTALEVRP